MVDGGREVCAGRSVGGERGWLCGGGGGCVL